MLISSTKLSMQHAFALSLALLSIHGVLLVDDAGCGGGDFDGLGVQRLYNDFISSSFAGTCCPGGGWRAMLISGRLSPYHWPPLCNYTMEAAASVAAPLGCLFKLYWGGYNALWLQV